MLGIILFILKIIGIVLLSILGLILLLVLLILFAPIHYRIEADYHGKPSTYIRVNWILHLIAGKLVYEDGSLRIQARALWLSLYDNRKNKKESMDSAKKKHKKDKKEKTIFDDDNSVSDHIPEQRSQEELNNSEVIDNNQIMADRMHGTDEAESYMDYYEEDEEQPEVLDIDLTNQEDKDHQSEQEQSMRTHRMKAALHSVKAKLVNIYEKILGLIKSVIQLTKDIIHKVTDAKERAVSKIQEVSEMIHDPENRELVRFLKEKVKKILKLIKPRKYQVELHYGFEDSELTGKTAMWLAVLYGLLGMNLNIRPDFEKEVFEGRVFMKGYVQLYGLIIIAIQCYTNKQIRKFMNK